MKKDFFLMFSALLALCDVCCNFRQPEAATVTGGECGDNFEPGRWTANLAADYHRQWGDLDDYTLEIGNYKAMKLTIRQLALRVKKP